MKSGIKIRNGRKVALAAIGVVIAIAISACSSGKATTAGSKAADPLKGKTIAFIQTFANPYYNANAAGITAAAKHFGAKALILQSNFSPTTERANVQDAITKQVAAVVFEPTTEQSVASNLALLNAAKIPTVVLNGYSASLASKVVGFIGVQDPETGGEAGELLKSAVPSGPVAVITGTLGQGTADMMLAGFKSKFGDTSRIVSTIDGNWDEQTAFKAAQDIITKTPDLKGLFVMNEAMAAGAVQALGSKAAGITIVSQNGSPQGIALIKSGTMTATVAWSPVLEGIIAVREINNQLSGHPLPTADKQCTTPTSIINKKNLSSAPAWSVSASVVTKGLATKCAS